MKKIVSAIISIMFLLTLVSCSAEKPTGSTRETEEGTEETKASVEVVAKEETTIEETTTETTEYIDPQCTDVNGMVIRPNPDQYIDPDIFQFMFYYSDYHGMAISLGMYYVGNSGVSLVASNGDEYSINVTIDKDHAQMIYDELAKYKFYYWQPEDYQIVDENGVITQTTPPYTFQIYSSQFINTTEVRLEEEDLEAFLSFCDEYCSTIAESQQGG